MFPKFRLFEELSNLEERLNDLLQQESLDVERNPGAWSPPVDIFEAENEFVLTAELPGVEREEVDVAVEGDRLTLRGQRNLEKECDSAQFHRIERRHGAFFRVFQFPESVDAERITAKMTHGVLTVTLPKRPKASVKVVELK